MKFALKLFLIVFSQSVFAANSPVANSAMPISGLHIVKLLAIFFGILSLIILSAYVLKKFNMVSWTQGPIKLLTGLSLSTKERIILIDVGGKQILIGVSPAGIETLHAFENPVVEAQPEISKANLFQTLYSKAKQEESPK